MDQTLEPFRYSTPTRTAVLTFAGWEGGGWKRWRGNRHLAAARCHAATTEAHRRQVAAQPKEEKHGS